jgi:hypothetical protein
MIPKEHLTKEEAPVTGCFPFTFKEVIKLCMDLFIKEWL